MLAALSEREHKKCKKIKDCIRIGGKKEHLTKMLNERILLNKVVGCK